MIYIVGEILYTALEIAIYFSTSDLSPKTSGDLAKYRTIVLLILRVSDLYLSIMFITIIQSYYVRSKEKSRVELCDPRRS